jgi:hypothetical protein
MAIPIGLQTCQVVFEYYTQYVIVTVLNIEVMHRNGQNNPSNVPVPYSNILDNAHATITTVKGQNILPASFPIVGYKPRAFVFVLIYRTERIDATSDAIDPGGLGMIAHLRKGTACYYGVSATAAVH